MKDFPEDLRGEISLQLNREILSLPVFEAATQGCLRSVALQTSRVFFGPGEVLIHKGDAIRNIYYVCSGSLEVLKDEQVVAILGKQVPRWGTAYAENNIPPSAKNPELSEFSFLKLRVGQT